MVADFVARCHAAGLAAIIEPISRARVDGAPSDLHAGILDAARELGHLGADLYKAEVPRLGTGGEGAVREDCAGLSRLIDGPWVVLSSGVRPDDFPTTVEWACKEGARGFLAGRAVWREAIAAPDRAAALRTRAVDRLKRLGDIVERSVSVRA